MGTGVSQPLGSLSFHVQGGWWGLRKAERGSPCLSRLHAGLGFSAQVLEGLEEQAFPQTAQYSDVFNDTSVHWFPVQKLKQLPMATWASREEPDYRDCEDLEIIRKQAGASATGPNGL